MAVDDQRMQKTFFLLHEQYYWILFFLFATQIFDRNLATFETFQDSNQPAPTREFFYPKALSSRKLFHLQVPPSFFLSFLLAIRIVSHSLFLSSCGFQLNDSSFRKNILVQFVILYEYLLTFSLKTVKEAPTKAPKPTFVLSEKQVRIITIALNHMNLILNHRHGVGC